MRMRDCCQHIEEEADSCFNAECAVVAIAIDMIALDVLEHQIRLSARGYASIYQFGDMRVGQPCENITLPLESFLTAAAGECHAKELDSNLPLEVAVVPL